MARRHKGKRKDNWGKPVKVNPRRPKTNCHVFKVVGKQWTLIPGHWYFTEAIRLAQRLTNMSKRSKNVRYVAKRKRQIIWQLPVGESQ